MQQRGAWWGWLGIAVWLAVACDGSPPSETAAMVDAGGGADGGAPGADAELDPSDAARDAGSPADGEAGDHVYPDPDWAIGDPADHGLDPVVLDAAGAAAERLRSHCLLVIRNGVLVYESYYGDAGPESIHRSWSIAKSYAGTMVGIAIDRGELEGLDSSVARHLPEWSASDHEAITVRHIVSMTSGLEWSAFQDYGRMAYLSSDHTGFALDLPLETAPGTDWRYHNGGVQILEPLIRNATGMSLEDYAEAHLWSRIGMRATWARDRAGNPTAYANVEATCRDHARFGYLYLRDGVWSGGARVVPEAWVREALEPSQPQNRGYGFLFWLNGEGPTRSALNEDDPEELVPYAPDDLFAARGFGNQFIDVIPSLDLVVVRMGEDPATTFDVGVLIDDARFSVHDEILQPILAAVR